MVGSVKEMKAEKRESGRLRPEIIMIQCGQAYSPPAIPCCFSYFNSKISPKLFLQIWWQFGN